MNKYTIEEVISGLNKAIRDKTNRYHHQYRSYTIELVVETEETDVYRVGYLNFENFDVIELKISKEEDFELSMALMQRESILKQSKGNKEKEILYENSKTFRERLRDKIRDRIKFSIIYGDLWEVSLSYLTNAKSYITIYPCVRAGVYANGTVLYLYTDILKVVRMNKEEENEYMDKIVKTTLEYAEDMSKKVKNHEDDVSALVGFERVEKVEI